MADDSRSLFAAIVGDGRSLIVVTAACLALSGAFAIFQSSTGHFLPHDSAFLQMTAEDLCGINECRIVHFMIHDRVSFGGAIFAVGVFYFWLAEFPLRNGQGWAWWTLLGSSVIGFGSFLTYLGYGYLDTWHGVATLALLPCFGYGMWRSKSLVAGARFDERNAIGYRFAIGSSPTLDTIGRFCLLASAVGSIGAGFTIQWIGMTQVFVQTDLEFMGLQRAQLDAINPRLIPLIAHDRAGFGGGVATAGVLAAACSVFSAMSRSLWQALLVAGVAGWTSAIVVHPVVGYMSITHLAPAIVGATLYFAGLYLVNPSRGPRNG